MAFIITARTLARVWEELINVTVDLRNDTISQKSAAQLGNVQSNFILGFESRLRAKRAIIVDLAAAPGLATYITNQPDTPPGYNVVNEYVAMLVQIDALISWIRTNFYKDASGYLLERKWDLNPANGLVDRLFSSAELAGYITQLSALLTSLTPV